MIERIKRYKIPILISLTLLAIVVVGFWFFSRKPAVRVELPDLPEPAVKPPTASLLVPTPSFSAELPNIPALPAYRYAGTRGDPEERALTVARALGFSAEHQELTDGQRGVVWLWSRASHALHIDSNPHV